MGVLHDLYGVFLFWVFFLQLYAIVTQSQTNSSSCILNVIYVQYVRLCM